MGSEDLRRAAASLRSDHWPVLQDLRDASGHGSMAAMVLTNLMRAAVQFSLALEQLADVGDLTAEIVRAEPATADAGQGRALELGRLHATTVILAGDTALDALAWAELERRDRWPEDMADRVISPWQRFIRGLDGQDDMLADAAYLDMTWCLARDALVAHQDPRLIPLPGFSGFGDITLAVATLEEDRHVEALLLLQDVQRRLPWQGQVPHGFLGELPEEEHTRRSWYHRILDHTLALPELLDHDDRQAVSRAQRLAGFESPPIHRMVPHILSLLAKHVQRRGAAQ